MDKNSESTEEMVDVTLTEKDRACDLFVRDSDGLLSGVDYVYRDNHTIDWRAMVNPEYTVVNRQRKGELEQICQKNFEEIKPEDVDDKHLLVLLAGFKELAAIRGYSRVEYRVVAASLEYVATVCRITWLPNYETQGQPLVFEALADATLSNTADFASNYLMAIAENRSFVRCVRNSLGINIVGYDEVGPSNKKSNGVVKSFTPGDPHGALQTALSDKKQTFSQFKEEWISLGNDGAKNWSGITDVPSDEIWGMLHLIKRGKGR